MRINLIKQLFFLMLLMLPICSANASSNAFLVILAHPDDETWISGSLATLAANNQPVYVVYLSSGDKGRDVSGQNLSGTTLANERETEAQRALLSLSIAHDPIFLRAGDSTIKHRTKPLINQLKTYISKYDIKQLISFGRNGLTGHSDHKAANQIANSLYQDLPAIQHLLQFEMSEQRNLSFKQIVNEFQLPFPDLFFRSHQQINLKVSVSEFAEERIRAFKHHKTQYPSLYATAWSKFVHDNPQEEFVVLSKKTNFPSSKLFTSGSAVKNRQ